MSTNRTQQSVLGCNDISQSGSLRGNQYLLSTRSNINNPNPSEFGGPHFSQMPPTGQQHYPSCPLRRSHRNGDRDSGVIFWIMVDIILIDLVVNVVIPMLSQIVVMVVPQ